MRALLVSALAILLVAGCFGGDAKPASRHASAVGGKVTHGWDYKGESVIIAGAVLDAILFDGTNNGSVTVSALMENRQVDILFDAFAEAPDKPFQDGGVAFDIEEHGDTGIGDAALPHLHALAAAWGKARVSVDGKLAAPEPWTAHLMVSQDTVRGPDGRITKADGTTPYDPATPADALRAENDPQAILFVKHPMGETYQDPPVNVSVTLQCQGAACSVTQEILTEPGATTLDLNLSVFGPDASLPFGALGQGSVSIVDGNGTELSHLEVAPQPTGGGPTATGTLLLVGAALPISATLTGDGIFSVSIVGSAQYASTPFLVFTWDEVTLEDG
ncbi:MAG TPA: hypothetical protein VM370_08000 [Candidatus Thermoplasmatota archaeon]|nr:hypothetical protein [Candidatus Thermoplasmatota archaeon]